MPDADQSLVLHDTDIAAYVRVTPARVERCSRRRQAFFGALAAALMVLVSSCGGNSSLSCSSFETLSAADQSDVISELSSDMGFLGNGDDVERMRSGTERSCAGNADQQIGSIVGGFVSALAD